MGCAVSSSKKKTIPKEKPAVISDMEELKFSSGNFVGKRTGALRQNYNISAKIGSGAFGLVYKISATPEIYLITLRC